MAIIKKNLIVSGLSGSIGKSLVFRQRGGQTFVSSMPASSNAPPTAGQTAQHNRFKEAARYAKGAVADSSVKQLYESVAKSGQTAYNMAMRDFFLAPEILGIDLGNYTGAVGDSLLVEAVDDFEVTTVIVEIIDGSGAVVESGSAAQLSNPDLWQYNATQANTALTGSTIRVKAYDRPGNETIDEITL